MTDQPQPLDLDAIEARANNATPGPWQWHISRRTRDYRLQTARWDIVMGFARWGRDSAQPEFNIDGVLHNGTDLDQPHPDAEFIANARQDVVDLLAEVRRLTAELDAEAAQKLRIAQQAVAEETRLRAELEQAGHQLAAVDDEIEEFEAAAQGDPNTPAGVLLMIQILRRIRPAAVSGA